MMTKFLNIIFIALFIFFTKSIALENKIILKIDNDIITSIDIFNEIKNLKFFNENLDQISEKEIYQIALQSVIRHRIKKNEVLRNFTDIESINQDYFDTLIENKFKSLGFKELKDFKEILVEKKISFKNLEEKLKVDIIWNQIIYSKFNNQIIINEDELKKKLQNEMTYTKSLNLREIVFQVQDANKIQDEYNLIKNDIEKIGFENTALKHSISSTADNGGNLGWVNESAINKELLNQLKKIELKAITKPIRISSGFLILQKYDEKQIEQNIDMKVELNKLINYEKNQQLNNFSNLYYNKVKKNMDINEP